MPRTIAADTFNRWWAALNEQAHQEPDVSWIGRDAELRYNAKAALISLKRCASSSETRVIHEGCHSNGQPIRRWVARGDTVTLRRPDEDERVYGGELIDGLIENIVALTGIEPDYVDAPAKDDDVQALVERLREIREARDK
jgi:hypothetical protein